jgi:hypothetical protein
MDAQLLHWVEALSAAVTQVAGQDLKAQPTLKN